MKRIALLLCPCFLMAFYSCDNKKIAPLSISAYPMQTGNTWVYDVTLSNGNSTANYTYTFRCAGDTTINGIVCSQLIKTELNHRTGITASFSHYYKNQSDGFYFIGGDSLTDDLLYFKKEADLFLKLFFKTEAIERGIFVCDQPLKLLSFPVNPNDSWLSNEYGSQSGFGRKYLSYEDITVDAGDFSCVKLQPYFDNNHDGAADSTIANYQWYGNKGLIKETSIQTATNISGGTIVIQHSASLKSVNF